MEPPRGYAFRSGFVGEGAQVHIQQGRGRIFPQLVFDDLLLGSKGVSSSSPSDLMAILITSSSEAPRALLLPEEVMPASSITCRAPTPPVRSR